MSTARSVKRVYEALSRTQHGTKVPSVLKETQQNLYEVLARLPESGKGVKVHQTRWSTKGFNNCYYEVTHAETKNEGKNGRAWGIPVWMGELSSIS
jgi:small subunit ribosomal protein S34